MPRPRPPHLHRERTRHGAVIWYVRIGHGPRIRLREPYGSPDFAAEYQAAVSGTPLAKPGKPGAGTLAWLVERYRESTRWTELSLATRRQRENVLKGILSTAGLERFADIDRKAILAGVDKRRDRPAAARHFLETLRGLFRWAVYAELLERDPTAGIDTPRDRKSEGWHLWTEEECQRFEARWPLGTRERLAFDVLLYTGLRRGDAVTLGRQHLRDGLFVIRTEKGSGIEAFIPILPPLAESLSAGPTGDLTFIVGEHGGNLTKESFGNWFAKVCASTGVPGRAHGLRKVAATRAAQFLTEAELEAMFAWERGSRVTKVYTHSVNRAGLARTAARKLNENNLFPHQGESTGTKSKTEGKSNG